MRAVVRLAPLAPVAHQSGVLKNTQVFGDGRLRHAREARQGVNGLFPVTGQPLKERPASGVGQSFENVVGYDVHSLNHNYSVMNCQDFFRKPRSGASLVLTIKR